MSETSMQSLREGHGAAVVGARGGIGAALSRPYAHGDGVFEPAESAGRLLGVLDRLDAAASGCLTDHAGAVIDP